MQKQQSTYMLYFIQNTKYVAYLYIYFIQKGPKEVCHHLGFPYLLWFLPFSASCLYLAPFIFFVIKESSPPSKMPLKQVVSHPDPCPPRQGTVQQNWWWQYQPAGGMQNKFYFLLPSSTEGLLATILDFPGPFRDIIPHFGD